MSGKKVAVFGIYSTRAAVENATDSLVKAGFPTSDISVLLPESLGGPKEMGTEKATKAPEGAAAGVTTGGVIGGTLGLLAGVGLLAIPGLDLSSLPVRSWPAPRGWESRGLGGSNWGANRNGHSGLKLNDTRTSAKGDSSPYIATRRTKSSAPRKLWNGPVEKTFPPPAKRPRIAARQTATLPARRRAIRDSEAK
jgi:hypothetical protein